MTDTEKEVNKPLLQTSDDPGDSNKPNDGNAANLDANEISFTVGADIESASPTGVADGSTLDATVSPATEPSPSTEPKSSVNLLPRARDTDSIQSGREMERNSSKSSLRGPVLTEPLINGSVDSRHVGEMRKTTSEQMSAANGNGNCLLSRLAVSDAVASNISLSRPGHHIVIEEIAPSASSILGDGKDKDWKMSINPFTKAKRGKGQKPKNEPACVRRYYKTQDELIDAFEELQLDVEDAMSNTEEMAKLNRLAKRLAQASFFINLLLLIGKSVAAGMSGSLAVVSSVIDSAVDLVSGALMWWSNRAIKKRNIYHYPQGRTKLEPVAIVILSVVMALASVQMIRESIEKIIAYATEDAPGPDFGVIPIVICSITIVAKFVLYMVCRKVRTPGVQALAQDHRNDVLSNSAALACGLIGDKLWKYADPIGAIVISIYIVVSWFKTGWEQTKMLTGHTARPEFLKKITWLALNHHSKVMLIDTVRAFHFGNNFLVEVDIVLPEEMSLRESHDIGETLQVKIERLQEVERAFVHLDYECEHHPSSEHKQV